MEPPNNNPQTLKVESNEPAFRSAEQIASQQIMRLLDSHQGENQTTDRGKRKYHEHQVPPDLDMALEYQKATSTGIVTKRGRRCRSSLMFLDNKPYSLCQNSSDFAEMGPGYAQFFRVSIFLMIFCVFPLMFTSTFEILRNWYGDDCIEREQLAELAETVGNATIEKSSRMLFLQSFSPKFYDERLLASKFDIYSEQVLQKRKNLKIFMMSFCYTKWFLKDSDCSVFNKQLCHKEYTTYCAKLALKKFQKEYDSRVCVKGLFSRASLANRVDLSDTTSKERFFGQFNDFSDIGTVIILLALLFWLAYSNLITSMLYNKRYTTVKDYSVLLKGLPTGDEVHDSNTNIRHILKTRIESMGYNVTQINFVYDTEKYLELKAKYNTNKGTQAKNRYKESLENNGDQKMSLLDDNLPLMDKSNTSNMIIKNLLDEQERNFDSAHPRGMSGAAIISFINAQQAERFLKDYMRTGFFYKIIGCLSKQKKPFYLQVYGIKSTPQSQHNSFASHNDFEIVIAREAQESVGVYRLYSERCPEPRDIIWANQAYKRRNKIWRRAFGMLFTLVILAVGIFIIFLIKVLFKNVGVVTKARQDHTRYDLYIDTMINSISSAVISLTDFILQRIVRKIVDFEKPRTFTTKHLLIARKLWKLQFMVSALIPLFYSITVMNYFGRGGLLPIVNGIFIFNIWMTPLINLFGDLFFWLKLWKRRGVRKFVLQGKGGPYTQGEANYYFEKQQWWISFKYASMIKNFAFGLFYMHIMPYAIWYTFIILFIQYWVEKVSFLDIIS